MIIQPTTIEDVIVLSRMNGNPGVGGLVTCSIMLTPEFAEVLLRHNDGNRKLDSRLVDDMARDIKDGRWKPNGTTISVSDAKRLTDGQHRCTAVVKTGIAIPVVLVTGVKDDPAVLATIDQTKPRTVQHILQIAGSPLGSDVIATSNLMCDITDGVSIRSTDRPAKADFARRHAEEIGAWMPWVVSVSKESQFITNARNSGTRSVGASALAVLVIHMVREGADPETVMEFFQGVVNPLSLPSRVMRQMTDNRLDLLQALHRRTRTAPLNRTGGGAASRRLLAEFAVHIVAYNRYLRDERVKMIRSFSPDNLNHLGDLPRVDAGVKR